jgi:hypothetical protein
MSDPMLRALVIFAASFGLAALAGWVVTRLAWRRAGRDVPFGAYYAATHRWFMFAQPMKATDWETIRIAGRRDVVLCQRIILVISGIALMTAVTLVAP